MRIGVRYMAQLKTAAGIAVESVELPPAAGLTDLVINLAARHTRLRALLLDADDRVQPTLLIFVGEEQVDLQQPPPLHEGAIVTLLSPIAGG